LHGTAIQPTVGFSAAKSKAVLPLNKAKFRPRTSRRGEAATKLKLQTILQKATEATKGVESHGALFPWLSPVQTPDSENARRKTTGSGVVSGLFPRLRSEKEAL